MWSNILFLFDKNRRFLYNDCMKLSKNIFIYIILLPLLFVVGSFVYGCEFGNSSDIVYTFDDSVIELELGEEYDLTTNKISEGTITEYSCKTLTITDNKIIADKLGDHIIAVKIDNGNYKDNASFRVSVSSYQGSVKFFCDNREVSSLSMIVGYPTTIEIDVTGLTPTINISGDSIEYNEETGLITPISKGRSTILATITRNNIEVLKKHLIINVADKNNVVAPTISDNTRTPTSTFYKRYPQDTIRGYIVIEDSIGNFADWTITGVNLDVPVDKVGDIMYVPFYYNGLGNVPIDCKYKQTSDTKIIQSAFSTSINIYTYASDVLVESSIPKAQDNRYHLYLPSQDKANARVDGYNDSMTLDCTKASENNNVSFALSCDNDGIEISGNTITAKSEGEYVVTISANDGGGYTKRVTILVEEIPCSSITLDIVNDTIYYIAYGSTIDIELGTPTIVPTYCTNREYSIEANTGTIIGTKLRVGTTSNITITVSIGAVKSTYRLKTVVKPSSLSLVALGSGFGVFEYAINYGGNKSYDNNLIKLYGYDGEWEELTANDAQINGNSITFISNRCLTLTKLKIVYIHDENIVTVLDKE